MKLENIEISSYTLLKNYIKSDTEDLNKVNECIINHYCSGPINWNIIIPLMCNGDLDHMNKDVSDYFISKINEVMEKNVSGFDFFLNTFLAHINMAVVENNTETLKVSLSYLFGKLLNDKHKYYLKEINEALNLISVSSKECKCIIFDLVNPQIVKTLDMIKDNPCNINKKDYLPE